MGRERDREIAAAVGVGRAGARQREDGAGREPFEVARVERRVGGDDDHAGAVGADVGSRGSRVGAEWRQLLPHRDAGDRQAAAVVRSGPARRRSTRRSAAARGATRCRCRPSTPNATVPVPAPTAPSSTAPSLRSGDRRGDVIARDVEAADVVQSAVVGLADERVDRADVLVARPRQASSARSRRRRRRRASVLVRTIGDSIVPSSCTCVEPASLPNALPTKTAPGTFSRKRLPPWGRIAVTPVRTLSPVDDRRVADAHARDVGDRVQRLPGLPAPG